MCGILGTTGNIKTFQMDHLLDLLEHRGRDERIVEKISGVNIGMNRLSILDLRTGLYPFQYKNYNLILNGEIYNYLLLQNKLHQLGVKLKTRCDAEVILPLYDIYGTKFLAMLEGMFAICIVDLEKNILILARDKMGEKPLYYYEKHNFSFASEIKVLLSLVNDKTLNEASLISYLSRGYVWGENTLITGIQKMLPAQYLVYDLTSKKAKKRYLLATSNTKS